MSKDRGPLALRISALINNNVYVNWVLSPLYFLVIFLVLKKIYHLKSGLYVGSAEYYSFLSTLVYVYASKFFQPDLDHHMNRPGKGSFPIPQELEALLAPVTKPIKKFIKKTRSKHASGGRIVKILMKPLIFALWLFDVMKDILPTAWNLYWKPFAYLFTHRGVPHWYVIGTWLRIWYVMFTLVLISKFGALLGHGELTIRYLSPLYLWCTSFFPWEETWGSVGSLLFAIPIYLSDFFHITVDAVGSKLKGTPFCANLNPRGILSTMKNSVKAFLRIG